ncbi:sporulation protein YunB, partial [Acutalibacter muris]
MRYIRKKFPRRYRGGGKKRRWAVWLVLAVIVIAVFCERAISGVSPELIEEAARGYVLECISEAVDAEMEEDKGPFVNVEKGSEGQVSLVSADQERLNSLRAGVLERLSHSLKGRATVYVPVGSLTGVGLFNGRGFPVPVKLQLEGSAIVEFSTEFTGAGMNQTCHRLVMTVRARA